VKQENIVSSKPLSFADVREALKEMKKEKELNYEQDQAMKHVTKFGVLTEKQTESMIESLKSFEELKDNPELCIVIATVLPQDENQLTAILPKGTTLEAETQKKILELTQKYSSKIEF